MHVTLVCGDDWKGLYVDGVLACEGHTILAEEALLCCGIGVEQIDVDEDWLEESTRLPKRLSEVPGAESDRRSP